MVSIQALCNSILKRSFKEFIPVSPMKLQKILYFLFREYLQKENKPLFSEEFLTWKYGPVIKSVYDEFKSFKDKPITHFAKDAQGIVYIVDEVKSPELARYIQQIWNTYKNYDGISLSKMTHKPNTAWTKAYHNKRTTLDIEDIRSETIACS